MSSTRDRVHWIVSLLVTAVFVASSGLAAAQTSDLRASDHVSDAGVRLHAAVGYPSIMAIGVGWKSAGGTEILVQGGGLAVWALVVGSAEVSASQDLFRRRWFRLHAGAAASLLHSHASSSTATKGKRARISCRLSGSLHRGWEHGSVSIRESRTASCLISKFTQGLRLGCVGGVARGGRCS